MRRPAIVAALILPFAFAALPLLSLFFGASGAGHNGSLAVTPATVAAVAPADTTDTTLAYGVSQPAADPCLSGTTGVEG